MGEQSKMMLLDISHLSLFLLPLAYTYACDCGNQALISGSTYSVADSKLTASDYRNSELRPKYSRLHMKRGTSGSGGSWADNGAPQWIQVEFDQDFVVFAIATQGRNGDNDHTKTYSVSYCHAGDCPEMTDVMEGESVKIFPGNTDVNTVVKHEFQCPIVAKKVRVTTITYYSRSALRWELYGCPAGRTGAMLGFFIQI